MQPSLSEQAWLLHRPGGVQIEARDAPGGRRPAARAEARPTAPRVRQMRKSAPRVSVLSTTGSSTGRGRSRFNDAGIASGPLSRRLRLPLSDIWSAPRLRAGRLLCCESGGRGGVCDLGGGEQPAAEARCRVDVALALGQDAECRRLRSQDARCPMEQSDRRTPPGLTPERVSGVPPRGPEMCLAQADSPPMAPFSGIAAVERQHAVADRREP